MGLGEPGSAVPTCGGVATLGEGGAAVLKLCSAACDGSSPGLVGASGQIEFAVFLPGPAWSYVALQFPAWVGLAASE